VNFVDAHPSFAHFPKPAPELHGLRTLHGSPSCLRILSFCSRSRFWFSARFLPLGAAVARCVPPFAPVPPEAHPRFHCSNSSLVSSQIGSPASSCPTTFTGLSVQALHRIPGECCPSWAKVMATCRSPSNVNFGKINRQSLQPCIRLFCASRGLRTRTIGACRQFGSIVLHRSWAYRDSFFTE
jgi:hypothetical protein